MRAPPESRKARAGVPGLELDRQKSSSQIVLQHNSRSTQAPIATIDKSYCSRLQVSLSEWRGCHSIDIRECTASIPGCFWPTSAGVTLDVSLVPQLLEAIVAVRREAIARGLLPGGRGMSDDTDDFDWVGADVVVHSQPATAVYRNPHGQIVVRQEGHYGPDEDAWIYFSIENVPLVAQAMLEAAGYETDTTFGEPLPKSEPLSGAERQRRYRNNKRDGNGDARVTELPLRPVTNGHHVGEEVLHAAE